MMQQQQQQQLLYGETDGMTPFTTEQCVTLLNALHLNGIDYSNAALVAEQGWSEQQEEWTMYNDDQGCEYWYNNYTGVSQYENPYA